MTNIFIASHILLLFHLPINPREIRRQNMRNSENIRLIVLRPVPQPMSILDGFFSCLTLISRSDSFL